MVRCLLNDKATPERRETATTEDHRISGFPLRGGYHTKNPRKKKCDINFFVISLNRWSFSTSVSSFCCCDNAKR